MGNICKKGESKAKDSVNTNYIHLNIKEWKNESVGVFNYKFNDSQVNNYDFLLDNSFTLSINNGSSNSSRKINLLKQLVVNSFTINNSNVIFNYSNNQITIEKPYETGFNNYINKVNNLETRYIRDIKNDFWIRFMPLKRYKIKPDTIIKFGKLRLEFSKIIYSKNKVNKNIINNKIKNRSFDQELYCRVCLEPENCNNLYVNTCSCTKTMPIHGLCLMDWIKKSTVVNKKGNYFYYEYKKLKCDICKVDYPFYLKINGAKRPLIDIGDFDNDIAIFNYCEKSSNNIKGVYIFLLSQDSKLLIGRRNDCDIILKDASISRKHCELEIIGDNLYVKDLGSKFGTCFYSKNIVINEYYNQIEFSNFLMTVHINTENNNCDCVSVNKTMYKLVEDDKFMVEDEITDNIKLLDNHFSDNINGDNYYNASMIEKENSYNLNDNNENLNNNNSLNEFDNNSPNNNNEPIESNNNLDNNIITTYYYRPTIANNNSNLNNSLENSNNINNGHNANISIPRINHNNISIGSEINLNINHSIASISNNNSNIKNNEISDNISIPLDNRSIIENNNISNNNNLINNYSLIIRNPSADNSKIINKSSLKSNKSIHIEFEEVYKNSELSF